MTYRLSRKAEDDIVHIFIEGAKNFGIPQAEKYHHELEDVFELISDNPEMARERTEITPPVRIHPHGSHIIVYTLRDDGSIFILRVRHAKEDWMETPLA